VPSTKFITEVGWWRNFSQAARAVSRSRRCAAGLAAPHEGKVERPPGQADQRYPDQLALEEELEEGDAAVEDMLQHQDVDGAEVVAGQQVPALQMQPVQSLHVPARRTAPGVHPALVERHPGAGQTDQQPVAAARQRGQRQGALEQCRRQQRQAQHHR
jgi:hypothetical protein